MHAAKKKGGGERDLISATLSDSNDFFELNSGEPIAIFSTNCLFNFHYSSNGNWYLRSYCQCHIRTTVPWALWLLIVARWNHIHFQTKKSILLSQAALLLPTILDFVETTARDAILSHPWIEGDGQGEKIIFYILNYFFADTSPKISVFFAKSIHCMITLYNEFPFPWKW